MDSQSRLMWEAVYGPLSDSKPGLVGELIARGEAHALRFAALYAVLDAVREIRPPHLLAGLALWQYAEDSARCVFGDQLGDVEADEVLRKLRAAGRDGATFAELYDSFSRNVRGPVIRRAVAVLVKRQLARVEREDRQGPGRRPERAYAVSPPVGVGQEANYLSTAAPYALNAKYAEIYEQERGDANALNAEMPSEEASAPEGELARISRLTRKPSPSNGGANDEGTGPGSAPCAADHSGERLTNLPPVKHGCPDRPGGYITTSGYSCGCRWCASCQQPFITTEEPS